MNTDSICTRPCLAGWGNRCGCGCIRCRAHTCFVRVQTALHAVHDAAAGEAAHHGLEVKCVAEDRREHTRYIPDVQADNEQRNQYIQDTHERNKDFGDACQTLCAAEYHYAEQERQNDTDERRRHGHGHNAQHDHLEVLLHQRNAAEPTRHGIEDHRADEIGLAEVVVIGDFGEVTLGSRAAARAGSWHRAAW